jgi:hypothetical protein
MNDQPVSRVIVHRLSCLVYFPYFRQSWQVWRSPGGRRFSWTSTPAGIRGRTGCRRPGRLKLNSRPQIFRIPPSWVILMAPVGQTPRHAGSLHWLHTTTLRKSISGRWTVLITEMPFSSDRPLRRPGRWCTPRVLLSQPSGRGSCREYLRSWGAGCLTSIWAIRDNLLCISHTENSRRGQISEQRSRWRTPCSSSPRIRNLGFGALE